MELDENSITNNVLPVQTKYLDSRRIQIQMNTEQESFDTVAYIFEYSTVSTAPDDWIFAGTNTTSEVIFTIPDPCRDYQFRVIAILKSNEINNPWLIVYRPRAIPVNLPVFAIAPSKIQTSLPFYDSEYGTIIVYVSWENPTGYTNADIYGYESPAIYPLQCNSPEEELPLPSVELNENGGRLRISLPSDVLDSKCRVWAEVQMLPRCIRLEPFSIQQSIELDCAKLPTLHVCRQEIAPQCTDIVDIWGHGDNATIMWSADGNFGSPLYYHIRYGQAEMRGVPPFATWKIALARDMKIPGNKTKLELHVEPDVDYGIQICGIYSEHKMKPKFGLIRVTPFVCTSCKTLPVESFGRCDECLKIEGPLLFKRRCHPKGGNGCANNALLPNITDFEDEDGLFNGLDVFPSDIFIDSFPEKLQTFDVINKLSSSSKHPDESSIQTTTTATSNSDALTFISLKELKSKLAVKLESSEASISKQFFSKSNGVKSTSVLTSRITPSSDVKIATIQKTQVVTSEPNKKLITNSTVCILANGVICEFGCFDKTKCNCFLRSSHVLIENGACVERSDHGSSHVCLAKADVKAIWSPQTHTLQIRSKEFNFKNFCKNKSVYIKIYRDIEMNSNYDRIFMEFGRIKHVVEGNVPHNEFISDKNTANNNKVILRSDKIIRNGLFLTAPYLLYTNQTIDPTSNQYGLRICAFNSSKVKNPFKVDWTKPSELMLDNMESSNNFKSHHLNAIHFELDYTPNAVLLDENKQINTVAFVIIPIFLIILLVIFLAIIIYVNCTRLKRCYDRRKTHHFRPFVWNSSIPPMCAQGNGAMHEKHSFMITKSTF
ncbi:unnamed protein product [Thelazia callipaeda]|uniref:Fibronectin type-III domain-containing protein n=1 Tax=Thelazia callipaeda TaxID=103827 RepID=A0A0N5CRJ0_THECL|nr:unnamed protein product [Thelazia callipaeda]